MIIFFFKQHKKMRKIELTKEQIEYIKENRIKMSMNQMATDLKLSFYAVS